VLIRQKPNTLH